MVHNLDCVASKGTFVERPFSRHKIEFLLILLILISLLFHNKDLKLNFRK